MRKLYAILEYKFSIFFVFTLIIKFVPKAIIRFNESNVKYRFENVNSYFQTVSLIYRAKPMCRDVSFLEIVHTIFHGRCYGCFCGRFCRVLTVFIEGLGIGPVQFSVDSLLQDGHFNQSDVSGRMFLVMICFIHLLKTARI